VLCGDWHSCLPEDRLFFVAGVALGEACTIVLRGATQQILDEAERSLHDALCVLAQTVKEPTCMTASVILCHTHNTPF